MSRPASFARYVNCPPAAGALVSIAGVFRCSKPGHVSHAGATSASRQVSESLVSVVFRHCLSCCVLYYCGDKRHLLRSYVVVAVGLCGSFALANGVGSLGGGRGEGTDATTRNTAALQQLLYYNRVHTCSTVCHIKVCSIGIHSLYASSTNHHHELCIMLGSAYMYHVISCHIMSYHVISCRITSSSHLIMRHWPAFSSVAAALSHSHIQLPLNTARRGTQGNPKITQSEILIRKSPLFPSPPALPYYGSFAPSGPQ